MRWKLYASARDRFYRQPAKERSGELWSDAPGGMWVKPDDGGPVAWVRRRPGTDELYEIEGQAPKDRPARLGPKAREAAEELAAMMEPLF